MSTMWESHQAADPIPSPDPKMIQDVSDRPGGETSEGDYSELPRPEYRFRSIGRNARLRTKLARVDQILANETGWLSAACRSSLDGAVSGFLDAVRVQSRELSQASVTRSRTAGTSAYSSTKRKTLNEMTPDERKSYRERKRLVAFVKAKLNHNV